MKYLWRAAFAVVLLVPVSYSHAEVTAVKRKSSSNKIRAFENLERRIAAMNDYSVVYTEADKSKRVMKSASGRQMKKSPEIIEVRLIKKKS